MKIERDDVRFRNPEIFERKVPKLIMSLIPEDFDNLDRFRILSDEENFGEFLTFSFAIDKQSESYKFLTNLFVELRDKCPEFNKTYEKAVTASLYGEGELPCITKARKLYRSIEERIIRK